jgi:magnesium chelatase family protein
MFSRIRSASTVGINAFIVEIETHLENGVPAFAVVGLPDSAVKESRERVSAAIKNSALIFPQKRITVNLAPADVRKEGSAFDLPIALGILSALGIVPNDTLDGTLVLGELALDGVLRPIRGALCIAMEARKQGFTRVLLPATNADEAAMVGAGMDVIPITTLREAVECVCGEIRIVPATPRTAEIFARQTSSGTDLADVKGQANVKRAMEVAAAGGHNLIMVGSPGSGKTMIAKRLTTILPPLTLEESLETTKIHSVSGILPDGQALLTQRPFRSPHHTISDAALVGGGMGVVRPGEISLAHHGVLFLDELPEFARNVLEVLRQPLEDRRITISRTKMTVDYPANFMLVCSMNPCPCGNFGNPNQECTCSPQQIQRYMAKISGPLLDRIDIHVDVAPVQYQELASEAGGEPSGVVRERVLRAREVQARRFARQRAQRQSLQQAEQAEQATTTTNASNHPETQAYSAHQPMTVFKNADMSSSDLREFCVIDEQGQRLMQTAMTRMGLSARAFDRILKVARTIADLADREQISAAHISEAIQYRSLDRQYWNA